MAITDRIKNPPLTTVQIGVDADKNVLPERIDDSESAQASLAQGFPMLTELTPSQGGTPPSRKDMNALFAELGTHSYFLQQGGEYQWDATISYLKDAVVWHHSTPYISLQGDNLGNEPQLTDSEYWRRVVRVTSINGQEPDGAGNIELENYATRGEDNTFTAANTFELKATFAGGLETQVLPVYIGENRTLESVEDNEFPTMKHVYEAISQAGGGGDTGSLIMPVEVLSPIDNSNNNTVLMEFVGGTYQHAYDEELRAYREVQYTKVSDTDWKEAASWQSNADSFTLTFEEKLEPFTQYKLRARDRSIWNRIGPWSQVVQFTTGETVMVEQPHIISISGESTEQVIEVPTVVASEFSTNDGYDTHYSTDWQIETLHTDGTPTEVVYQSLNDRAHLTSITIPRGHLKESTAYTIKVRYKGTTYGYSDWGHSNFATADRFTYVETPSITIEGNGANTPEDPRIKGSAFKVISNVGEEDTHRCTSWVVNNLDNDTVWSSIDDPENLTSIQLPKGVLQVGTTYTVRCQYKGNTFISSWGSKEFTTAEEFAHVAMPTLNVTGAPDNVPETATLSGSEFQVIPTGRDTDTHIASTWEIYSADGSEEIWASRNDSEHLTSITLPPLVLQEDTTYLFKLTYIGEELGASATATVTGTTKSEFTYIAAPSLTVEGGPNDVRETPTLTGSEFTVVSNIGEEDTHASTDWRVLKADDDSVVFENLGDTEHLTSYTLPISAGLEPETSYKFQVRYTGAKYGASNYTTVIARTHTVLAYIVEPTLTVTGTPDSVPETPTLSLSPFTVHSDNEATDEHVSTDWEIVPASGGAAVWSSMGDAVNKTSIQVPKGTLAQLTTYRFRARFNGSRLGSTAFVEVTGTTLAAFDFINTPTISLVGGTASGTTNVLETPTFKGSDFSYTSSSGAVDTHAATDWKITTAADTGTPVWSQTVNSGSGDLTSITVPKGTLQVSTAYIVFVRYRGASFGYSPWAQLSFTTNSTFTYIAMPTLSVRGAPSSVQEQPALTGGPFTVLPAGQNDTHECTDWRVTAVDGGATVWESIADSSHLTSIKVPSGKLHESTAYKFAVRYKGATCGYSAWAEVTATTAAEFSPIGAPDIVVEQDNTGVYEAPLITGSAYVNESDIEDDDHSATDWVVTPAAGGEAVWQSLSDKGHLRAIQMPNGVLQTNTAYRFQARYQGFISGWGPWNEVTATTQSAFYNANMPQLLNANIDRAGTSFRFEFSTTQLYVRPGKPRPTHLRVKIKNNTKDDYIDTFTTAIESSGNYIITRPTEYDLDAADDIVFQVFYKGDASDNDDTPYSDTAEREATVNENIIVMLESISGGQHHVYQYPTIRITLNYGPQSFTHTKTDWEIRDVTNTQVIWSSMGDTSNLTSIKCPVKLDRKTFYTLNIKAYGTRDTDVNAESIPFEMTLLTSAGGDIGVPGEWGFGLGLYESDTTAEDLVAMGLTLMEGGEDPTNDNYGNYIHTNGSVFVFVPAFCYSFTADGVSELGSPSAFDVKSFTEFENEADANEQGYILHRAFIDGGQAKSGFFITKYLMGKGNIASKGNIPISLINSTSAPSTAEGGTGQARDALTLSKKLGSQYNCASVFMYSALAMLSFAHGLSATSTETCAWYDPAGTTNFPKGCNNGALGDTNDSSVTYAHSDTTAGKPNTGSATPFAKTTHNGQNSGVCDLNGCLEQVAVGVMQYDASTYILPDSASFTAYTYDNVASTNSTVYASHSLGSLSGNWGSASANQFYTDQNGVNRALCGVFPPKAESAGTNEFGTDTAYRGWYSNDYNYGAFRCSGSWSAAAGAGIFYRYVNSDYYYYDSWANSVAAWGFRAAAYGAV